MSATPSSFFEVIFDIETQNFFDDTGSGDPGSLKASVVSLYSRELDSNLEEIRGNMYSFWEHELENMWGLFRNADRVIGFNTKNFDIPVLAQYAPPDFIKLPHFDIYQKIKEHNEGRAAGLNAIARDTLGTEKIDSGANAVMYWKKGDPDSLALLRKYCEADVMITRDIYDFALKNRFLKFTDRWNTPRTATVDFSYANSPVAVIQSSLF